MTRPSCPVLTSRRGLLARLIVWASKREEPRPITLASQRRAYAWRLALLAVLVLAVALWRGQARGEEPGGWPGKIHTKDSIMSVTEIALHENWVSFKIFGEWATVPRESVLYIEWANVGGLQPVPRYTVPGMGR